MALPCTVLFFEVMYTTDARQRCLINFTPLGRPIYSSMVVTAFTVVMWRRGGGEQIKRTEMGTQGRLLFDFDGKYIFIRILINFDKQYKGNSLCSKLIITCNNYFCFELKQFLHCSYFIYTKHLYSPAIPVLLICNIFIEQSIQ